ncbi:Gpi1-domain-containing protein [Metschnikowia bicuspidata var. bicuspidata NRRL YB-4993]|uniref:Gpi1-domain-containing protein n=1 Tax=Metschnikowia bicuspidata var. bicuspidata NRRL YB-4993 TaxID=869754 RepID=A0A1A0H7C7_9ASCO|nr:Gpi1-domain-containing protein [Metschnikowia bicuspidata var. bicuspidata NRRL YB-4993]OBA19999.1 Gpi1-domain-containing protein [Metschnikowia bicuspidata var. bicuspidata NRRL YB-4993]
MECVDASKHQSLYLRFHSISKLPFVDPRFYSFDQKFVIIVFAPPNLRNLEYFTVRPILLQSTYLAHETEPYTKSIQFLHNGDDGLDHLSMLSETVLDKINACSKTRVQFRALNFGKSARKSRVISNALLETIGIIISVLVRTITYLDTEIFGKKLVQRSTWCRQLDIRLRQVSFFPFQYLSYYDTSFLRPNIRQQLGIPMSNERYNINNSNYINLYNTLWLMINDILIGCTIYRVVSESLTERMNMFNNTLLAMCFTKLNSFITWIGCDYPGGLKLNNDLGQFMELLFLWTSQLCGDVFKSLIESDSWFNYTIKLWFQASCYLGVSFVTAFFIDYIKIVNIHVYLFSLGATKIYHRQVEMLKSLMQLFRGRKYNILRNRIDKIEEDQLRIDQLLLGTFIFLVLIYLLPTTFAFYFLFYASRVAVMTCLKLGEKVILCLNLYPLFVVLLKLKNSRRLQGGIHFTHKGHYETTDWLFMENKALTFDEIFGNFVHVFRQEGRLERLLLNFAEGLDLQVKDTSCEKFQYLMLPKNHTSLVEVWGKAANSKGR